MIAAAIRGVSGDLESACRLIEEAWAIPEAAAVDEMISTYLPETVRCACDAGKVELAERILRDVEPRFPYAAHALVGARARVAEAHGRFEEAVADYRDAAARWMAFSMPFEEGHARLGEARCLIALERRDEAHGSARAISSDIRTPGCGSAIGEPSGRRGHGGLRSGDGLRTRQTCRTDSRFAMRIVAPPCRTSDGSSSFRRPWTYSGSSISRLEQ